jgi:hypothetical protein
MVSWAKSSATRMQWQEIYQRCDQESIGPALPLLGDALCRRADVKQRMWI